MWERGLKYSGLMLENYKARVAPRVGAWIEMFKAWKSCSLVSVAPRVGAWIEIDCYFIDKVIFQSLPVWERGLK